jgi:hypothetical protein
VETGIGAFDKIRGGFHRLYVVTGPAGHRDPHQRGVGAAIAQSVKY